MKVGFYQFDVTFGDKAGNLDKLSAALTGTDFDLIVLPELFTTGYLFGSKEEVVSYAEPVPHGETTRELLRIAQQNQAFIVGGMAEIEGERVYNTVVVAGPEGLVGKHRKIHLPRFELPLFDRGTDLNVFDLNGVTIGVVLCFESWFPEMSRLLTLKGAQILCHPANFGGPWSLDMIRVRAMENIVYTITANRTGEEERNDISAKFRGESQVVRYDGDVLLRVGDQETLAVVDIDAGRAREKHNMVCDDLLGELAYYDMLPLR